MKAPHFCVSALAVVLFAFGAWPGLCSAQWSNPLLTEGVGSGNDLSAYYYRYGPSPRGSGRARSPGDKNPAETLLREMNGTHYRRHTGQPYFRGRHVEEARRLIARRRARDRRSAGQAVASHQGAEEVRAAHRSNRAKPHRLPPPRGPVY